MSKSLYGLHEDTVFWLKRLSAEAFSTLDKTLRDNEISMTEWSVLMALLNGDASNVAELSRFIEVDKASISRTVTRLEERGYLTRKPGEDRRSFILVLSKSGQALAKKLAKKAQDNESSFLQCLSGGEKQSLKKIMKKLLESAGVDSVEGVLS